MAAENGGEVTRVRSRRRRSGNRGALKLGKLVHAPWFDKAVNITVLVAALVYTGLMVNRFHSDTFLLGFRPLGSPRSEVLYGFGRPEFVSAGGGDWKQVSEATGIDGYPLWRYRSEGGGQYLFHFDGTGTSDEVTCFHPTGDRGTCPGLFFINQGDGEDRIGFELGSAPVRMLQGTSAVLRYPSIGVDFELQQYKIRRFTLRTPKSSIIGRIPRFIRFAIP